jgi:hypothetical protein
VSFPPSPPPVPTVVGRYADGGSVRAVWINEERRVTFRLKSGRSVVPMSGAPPGSQMGILTTTH